VKTRIEVVPTGLPADRYVQGNGAAFRRAYRIPQDRPLLLYVGRVAHEKNIDFLLTAFTELRRTRPDAMFAIAGEGPALSHLRSQVDKLGLNADVFFIGYLAREGELANCYASADVFIFASRTETQGLVLLEALAQGRPVVSTAHLGTTSILRAGCGARVAPERAEAFAQSIADVLEDPARAARLSEQAHAYALTWASSRMAARLAGLYQDLLRAATQPASAAA
jgi:1,2-diacylglycerol 3-alpha-glucosyltransferase